MFAYMCFAMRKTERLNYWSMNNKAKKKKYFVIDEG